MSTAALAALSVAAASLSPRPASAQSGGYPNKPLRWVVGYPAGGGTDFLARAIATQLATQLGQSVVIDNRPGAGAIIGSDLAAKSPGDGYTIFSADNGVLVYNPALYKKLPYDPTKDFALIGLMARAPLLLVAAPTAGIKTGRELMDRLKREPGKLSYGSPGNGSPHHLAMELFKSRSGLFAVHVPYRGAAPAMQDVMGGQIPMMVVDLSSGIGPLKAGKVVPLMVMSAKRLPAPFAEVPTAAELGVPGVDAYAWQGLVVPSATPADIRARLGTELQAALANADVRRKLQDAAWDPIPGDAAAMTNYVASETKVWHALIKERRIALD